MVSGTLASMSPNGCHVVAVGDTRDVTVFDVRGNDYTVSQQHKGTQLRKTSAEGIPKYGGAIVLWQGRGDRTMARAGVHDRTMARAGRSYYCQGGGLTWWVSSWGGAGGTASFDSAFSCAWSPCSTMYAVGSQDGTVAVWDVRSHRVLARMSSKLVLLTFAGWNGFKAEPDPGRECMCEGARVQAGMASGAVRAIKFAPAPLDLLVFSEVGEPLTPGRDAWPRRTDWRPRTLPIRSTPATSTWSTRGRGPPAKCCASAGRLATPTRTTATFPAPRSLRTARRSLSVRSPFRIP